MASYGDQKHLLKQSHIELDDQMLRDRSLSMPASAKENIPVVRRRTIFDPPINIFSPEENTSDYLEDYIENLGEYHVYRDTRHLHLHTPLTPMAPHLPTNTNNTNNPPTLITPAQIETDHSSV